MAEQPNLYVVTGVDRRGRRFRIATGNRAYALAHNVWRGTLWEVSGRGKGRTRKAIHRWWN